MTYILVDTANTFFRARHVINGDADIKLGMAFHITLNSIRKAWQQFNGSHVIFCLEGRSWRKDYYAPYKRIDLMLVPHTQNVNRKKIVYSGKHLIHLKNLSQTKQIAQYYETNN